LTLYRRSGSRGVQPAAAGGACCGFVRAILDDAASLPVASCCW